MQLLWSAYYMKISKEGTEIGELSAPTNINVAKINICLRTISIVLNQGFSAGVAINIIMFM